MARRGEKLEEWLLDTRTALTGREVPTALGYDDRVGGDVLVLALYPSDPDRVSWLTTTRRTRGQLHLTAMTTTRAAAAAAAAAVAGLHAAVPRLANVRRKYLHRIERMLVELDERWDQRAILPAGLNDAIATLRAVAPSARPAIGVGFHTDLAGSADHHTKTPYPPIYGAAVDTTDGWRVLPWDTGRRTWAPSTATAAALQRAAPGVDLAVGGVVLDPALAAAATGFVVGGAALAMAAAASDEPGAPKNASKSNCDVGSCDVCDPSWLGDLVPDCDLDCGDLGVGDCSPDCSL
ncbi:MAG: hypothetical protein KBG48_33715 [Kofleriaceae bacterium]|nr:hypothetical protein [Kofleriaceae bacterium]MBP9172368.1 hypothetical protein [Kofleriaceae bacterium]MBP9863054.1 hypothetical protein [Kofleriaceae bacterium]